MKRAVSIALVVIFILSMSACQIGTSTVRFHSYARYEHADIYETIGSYVTSLPQSYKIGYDFVGWSYSEEEIIMAYAPLHLTSYELDLYAIYEINEDEFLNFTVDLSDYSKEVMLIYSKNYIWIKNPEHKEISKIEVLGDVECAFMSASNYMGRSLGQVEDSNIIEITKTTNDIVLELDALFDGNITIKIKAE